MKRLESRRYVMKFGSFGDSTSSSIENELKLGGLFEKMEGSGKRVTVVNL